MRAFPVMNKKIREDKCKKKPDFDWLKSPSTRSHPDYSTKKYLILSKGCLEDYTVYSISFCCPALQQQCCQPPARDYAACVANIMCTFSDTLV
jgi:hypothetical protein